jgi:hypothetical protein
VLLAKPNIVTGHYALEVYDYSCLIVVVEKPAPRSCQLALKVLIPSDGVDPPHECVCLVLLR